MTVSQEPSKGLPRAARVILGVIVVLVVVSALASLDRDRRTPGRTLAPAPELADRVTLMLSDCTSEAASGTVRNDSDLTVTIFVDVEFLDDGGTIVDNGIDSVHGVRPGETARWKADYVGNGSFSKCRGNVRNVFPE
jgi:hypothetical protein